MPDEDKGLPLEENPNWKGGRTITSHGYVLVKRPNHPRADTRGYVYEHRVVVEENLGRILESDEQVHHKNGDRQDNDLDNLEILSIQEHRARHRENDELREPGEQNPIIECSCECGTTFRKYDNGGRPREYISGHNPQERPTQEKILDALRDGPMNRQALITSLGKSEQSVATSLSLLKGHGEVVNPKYGVWALPEDAGEVDTEREENPAVECACGCGETFPKYDDSGRAREYASGHNNDSPVRDGILDMLAEGPAKRGVIAETLNMPRNSVGSALSRLKDEGAVKKADGWGMWELNGDDADGADKQ